jgi:methylphosphotriester-DNA--protein-cysteine methyltransferase
MNIVQKAARDAINRHGGVTKAARALSINRTVLRLLSDCKRESATDATIRKLGLKLVPMTPADAAAQQ